VTSAQRGSVLVEFALTSLVVSLLLAASVEFGRLMFSAQGLQDIARVAARELALIPLPADFTFDQALADPAVQSGIFDPARLVVDLDCFADDAAIDSFFAGLPPVNRALRPLMIVDRSRGLHLLRYPGALLADPSVMPGTCPSGGFTVGIPRVVERAADGVETIEWIPVVEEIRTDPADPLTGSFSLASPQGGLVALRVNYPYQAAALSGFRQSVDGPFEPNLVGRIRASDEENDEVGQVNPGEAPGDLLPDEPLDGQSLGAYAGVFGLGRQLAFAGERVRPFRKLLSAQAIYRREVFLP
jgi:hypothetical protein